jgi:hypothetical protein
MGALARDMVKKAARLAVYKDTIMIVNIHHIPSTTRPEADVGVFSSPMIKTTPATCIQFVCFVIEYI